MNAYTRLQNRIAQEPCAVSSQGSLALASVYNPPGRKPRKPHPTRQPIVTRHGGSVAKRYALPKDAHGNAHVGDVLTHNSHNTFVHASSRLVSLLTW